jgi:hypothetical protein
MSFNLPLRGEQHGEPKTANESLRVVNTSAIFAPSLVILGPPGCSPRRGEVSGLQETMSVKNLREVTSLPSQRESL